ncbi:MAG: hypothetical protein ACRDIF_03855 [Actinomycetota bacterium]
MVVAEVLILFCRQVVALQDGLEQGITELRGGRHLCRSGGALKVSFAFMKGDSYRLKE